MVGYFMPRFSFPEEKRREIIEKVKGVNPRLTKKSAGLMIAQLEDAIGEYRGFTEKIQAVPEDDPEQQLGANRAYEGGASPGRKDRELQRLKACEKDLHSGLRNMSESLRRDLQAAELSLRARRPDMEGVRDLQARIQKDLKSLSLYMTQCERIAPGKGRKPDTLMTALAERLFAIWELHSKTPPGRATFGSRPAEATPFGSFLAALSTDGLLPHTPSGWAHHINKALKNRKMLSD